MSICYKCDGKRYILPSFEEVEEAGDDLLNVTCGACDGKGVIDAIGVSPFQGEQNIH